MTTAGLKEKNLEKQIEKQMGCMAGFLQIFDRHQILTGKRLYSAKRLPPTAAVDTTSESGKSTPASPASSRDSEKPIQPHTVATPSPPPPPAAAPATELQPKSPLPLPIFELKEGTKSSWKFHKEAPRLSLDSRATTDAKGGLHPKEIRTTSILSAPNRCNSIACDTSDGGHNRSPSVIAKLMGLEPLPSSSGSEPEKKPELRRSASESRVSKDFFQSRFIPDASNFYPKQQTQSHFADNTQMDAHYADPRNHSLQNGKKTEPVKGLNRGCLNSTSPWGVPQQRKSFFDSGDIFPEPKQSISVYGEFERRLKMRGIDEPSKDLETLKQILEALQLKGLLHSKPQLSQQHQVRHRNFVYDESPIVLMKPSRTSPSTPVNRRIANDYWPSNGKNPIHGVRRNYTFAGETSPSVSPRRERNVQSPTRTGRSSSPTTRSSEGNASARRLNAPVKPKSLSIETQRANESPQNRRASPVRSPKLNARRTGSDPTVSNRSPRSKKATSETHQKEKITTIIVAEDESSSISGSSITTSTDTERSKAEEYKEGRNLLERCDKLLHSIAEMAATDMQPSPVSVLDSSFYKDESLTPSPVITKRNIDFKDQSGEFEEEIWSPVISPIRSKRVEVSDDCDFVYVADILRASHYLPDDSDVFLVLENQEYLKGNDTSKVSKLQRKLIFDTINEILDRNRLLPPWKAISWMNDDVSTPSLDKIWLEFQRIRERDTAEDLFEFICGVLKKDLARDMITGWDDCPVETSEMVLDIERLIFKDLISETIWDLAALSSKGTLIPSMMPRRKLVF
ncbi:hypothetical protein CDL12_11460 [Handroanthus impetiginosus]|uniref:DUF4378 domain-containing protein n=1 Tax=Handroanthus impetiginosus TaxID=429701 RepID=A0A2G9HF40_9LAMI|nr:hypothetical protein CDL12_11460 [Handroanthus impetiginosus]